MELGLFSLQGTNIMLEVVRQIINIPANKSWVRGNITKF